MSEEEKEDDQKDHPKHEIWLFGFGFTLTDSLFKTDTKSLDTRCGKSTAIFFNLLTGFLCGNDDVRLWSFVKRRVGFLYNASSFDI